MNKTILILICAAVFFSSVSCAAGIRVEQDEKGNIVDKANDRYYIYCDDSIRAVSVKEVSYANIGSEYLLYEIIGMNPELWLSEDITGGIPYVFREQNVPEPTLSDFKPHEIFITQTEVVTMQIGHINDLAVIEKITGMIIGSDEVDLPSGVSSRTTLNFASAEFPGLYYTVQFLIDNSGNPYFYDRGKRRCVDGYFFEENTAAQTTAVH